MTGKSNLAHMVGKFLCLIVMLVPKHQAQYQGWAQIEKFQISIIRAEKNRFKVKKLILHFLQRLLYIFTHIHYSYAILSLTV